MNESTTVRGFALNTLTDNYGNEFSVQKSSAASDDFVWVGVDDPRVQVGPPWQPFEMPANALIHSRAHLTREQAREVATALMRFAETGEL